MSVWRTAIPACGSSTSRQRTPSPSGWLARCSTFRITTLRMFLEREPTATESTVVTILYAGTRLWPGPLPASYAVRARAIGPVKPATVGTLEHFLVERYILFTQWNDRLYRGRVHHRPYPLQSAEIFSLDETLLSAAAITRPGVTPMAHFASGVDVEVFPLEAIAGTTS